MPAVNWAMITVARKMEPNRLPPIGLAMSSGALAESVKTPPGCTSWVT